MPVGCHGALPLRGGLRARVCREFGPDRARRPRVSGDHARAREGRAALREQGRREGVGWSRGRDHPTGSVGEDAVPVGPVGAGPLPARGRTGFGAGEDAVQRGPQGPALVRSPRGRAVPPHQHQVGGLRVLARGRAPSGGWTEAAAPDSSRTAAGRAHADVDGTVRQQPGRRPGSSRVPAPQAGMTRQRTTPPTTRSVPGGLSEFPATLVGLVSCTDATVRPEQG